MLIEITDREFHTVLAALRYWQAGIENDEGNQGEIADIASNGGDVEPLDGNDIDALCEAMNCGERDVVKASGVPIEGEVAFRSLVASAETLVAAYVNNPEDVDWSDVQDALAHALTGLGLPADYPETEHEKRVDDGTQSAD